MNEIENWYDNQYDEWNRLDRHKIEFEITKRYMNQYIDGDKLEILDIGGGPGRYSFYLTEQGHSVTLLDLSQKNIEVAKQKEKELGLELKKCIKGNALELDSIDGEYDVVLLMGPLYHLIKEEDRKRALDQAVNKLRKGGILFASFISNYAPIQDCFAYLKLDGEDNDVEEMLRYLRCGENKDGMGFTTAYFTGVDEAKKLMEESGLQELAFAGVENILGCKEREILTLSEEERIKWIELGYALSRDCNLYGTSQHFLYVGRKE
ncbi:class I SAM-dependent methyltransferase [Anaeromicropila herbilytica]|uniref:Methyltransferase domain-containing protein n=1 Tax=Anaeromicropila herbilytica TaxID=2785025 RepID=A0A7R7EPR3_9FIRM|nr:class I SAM-dependent methyltransferase [Anaeromicropila herbilytica]BCN32465.1 hypothetical protein bsdtb5_37600 [Anaeromicropila herbilytica]